MALFVCEKCGCVDSTVMAYNHPIAPNTRLHCTVCQGKKWHNQFPRRTYDSKQDVVVNSPTLLMD